MMLIVLSLIVTIAWGAPPIHWSTLLEVRERHEFYQDNEVISRPKGSWQSLFGVVYPDQSLGLNKDCAYYKVPGQDDGVFKVRAVPMEDSCEKHVDDKGDLEVPHLKALQFSFGKELTLHFTFSDYRTMKWTIPLLNQFKASSPASFTSSAEYRAPKLTMLAPMKTAGKGQGMKLKNGELCHSIGDDCEELQKSTCGQCPEGWYETPNGCPQGPKYCGNKICGLKNNPACRRGMKYQRMDKKFECRTDSSFAYCAPGLTVQCEGSRSFCR